MVWTLKIATNRAITNDPPEDCRKTRKTNWKRNNIPAGSIHPLGEMEGQHWRLVTQFAPMTKKEMTETAPMMWLVRSPSSNLESTWWRRNSFLPCRRNLWQGQILASNTDKMVATVGIMITKDGSIGRLLSAEDTELNKYCYSAK